MIPNEQKRRIAVRMGVIVLVILAVLTAAEYAIATAAPAFWILLVFIALIKANYVMRNYMHIGRVFAGEEADE